MYIQAMELQANGWFIVVKDAPKGKSNTVLYSFYTMTVNATCTQWAEVSGEAK